MIQITSNSSSFTHNHHFGLWRFHFLNLTLFISCARTSQDKALQNKCVDVLLKFLSHPLPEVKEQTYSTIKQVVKVSGRVKVQTKNVKAMSLNRTTIPLNKLSS